LVLPGRNLQGIPHPLDLWNHQVTVEFPRKI